MSAISPGSGRDLTALKKKTRVATKRPPAAISNWAQTLFWLNHFLIFITHIISVKKQTAPVGRFVLCQPHYFEYSNEALIATARASDMSSGPAISFTPRVMATIFLSALLSHLPSPATTLLISVGENSRTGTPRPSETKTITPLASATARARS